MRRRTSSRHRVFRSPTSAALVGLLVFALLLVATPVWAQTTEQSSEELNQAGIAALDRGEYERAVRLFSEALELDELNVVYLNLGRAYARWGKCDEARQAYDRVPDAPAVEAPPRDKVLEVLYRYRLELDEQCAADEEEPEETVVETTPIERPPAEEPTSLRPLAIGLLGVGTVALGTSLIVETVVLHNQKEAGDETAFRRTRRFNQALVIGGGLVAATGAVLLFVDPGRERSALCPVVGHDRLGVAWEVRW